MKIAIIGLGYVGLPLAVAFAEHYPTVGFDINRKRIVELQNGLDHTQEMDRDRLQGALSSTEEKGLTLTDNNEQLSDCTVFIVTVPTPITKFKTPDLGPLLAASATVGRALKSGDIVIYESTVYPGCTEEDCVPVLEKVSGLKYNVDFFCGYSPERINPGDRKNTLETIQKVVSGSTEEVAEKVEILYRSIVPAGTFRASSIKVAEACKAI